MSDALVDAIVAAPVVWADREGGLRGERRSRFDRGGRYVFA